MTTANTEKTFTIAGISTLSGKVKPRFANGTVKVRVKVLERNEHTDIDLRELPNAMTKADAKAWLVTNGLIEAEVEETAEEAEADGAAEVATNEADAGEADEAAAA